MIFAPRRGKVLRTAAAGLSPQRCIPLIGPAVAIAVDELGPTLPRCGDLAAAAKGAPQDLRRRSGYSAMPPAHASHGDPSDTPWRDPPVRRAALARPTRRRAPPAPRSDAGGAGAAQTPKRSRSA